MKEWLFLIGAIFLETFATLMLKYSEQFTKLLYAVIDANPKFHKLYQMYKSVA